MTRRHRGIWCVHRFLRFILVIYLFSHPTPVEKADFLFKGKCRRTEQVGPEITLATRESIVIYYYLGLQRSSDISLGRLKMTQFSR